MARTRPWPDSFSARSSGGRWRWLGAGRLSGRPRPDGAPHCRFHSCTSAGAGFLGHVQALCRGRRGCAFDVLRHPQERRTGRGSGGRVRLQRASSYEATDIADTVQELQAAGWEIGVHATDAWRDSAAGREELERVRQLTGTREVGVRMHGFIRMNKPLSGWNVLDIPTIPPPGTTTRSATERAQCRHFVPSAASTFSSCR